MFRNQVSPSRSRWRTVPLHMLMPLPLCAHAHAPCPSLTYSMTRMSPHGARKGACSKWSTLWKQ